MRKLLPVSAAALGFSSRGSSKSWLFFLCVCALMISGCAGSNPLLGSVSGSGRVAGFWSGLWHGMICPIAFVISLFNSKVSIYEVHNSGAWYNGGFIIGAGAWGILGRGGAKSRD